jgi:predicted NBD/HSP70 family sugar kinase
MKIPANERMVLQLIGSRRATSQIHLARCLKSPGNTVHGVIRRLLKDGLIQSERTEIHGRGRPIQHYRLCRSAPVLAIQWLGSVWHAGVFRDHEAMGRILSHSSPFVKKPGEVLQILKFVQTMALRRARLSRAKLAGAILEVNAVKTEGGRVLSSSVIPWVREISAERLSTVLGCPTQLAVESPVASAELRLRVPEGIRSLVVFNVGDGVSAHGLSLDDTWGSTCKFYGELGHVVADPRGPWCGCGNRGCLEALISGPALMLKLEADLQHGVQTRMGAVLGKTPDEYFARLETLDAAGSDPYARTVAEEFIERCGWGISLVVNLLRPDVIVLGGYGLDRREGWRTRMLSAARKFTLPNAALGLRLEFPRLQMKDHLQSLAQAFKFQTQAGGRARRAS